LIKGGKEVYGWDRTMCLDIINIDDENLWYNEEKKQIFELEKDPVLHIGKSKLEEVQDFKSRYTRMLGITLSSSKSSLALEPGMLVLDLCLSLGFKGWVVMEGGIKR
jgi:hypothetical protein